MKKLHQILLLAASFAAWSIGAAAQERTVELVKDGQVVFSMPAREIEYMTIVNRLHTPENVRGSVAGGKVTVTWDAVDGATSYQVFRSADGDSFSLIGTSSDISFVDNAPLSGSNYYRIQALGADGIQSGMSAAMHMAIVNSLHAPENVCGSVADGKVTVIWDAVWGATSYKVFRSADGNSFSLLGLSLGDSFMDNSPLDGTNYYRVQALGADNMQSDMSATAMTIVNRLHAPENVRGSAAGGKVTVTWDVVRGATSYNVFRSADGNSFLPLGTSSGTSFTDNAPLPGASYYYCVQALGAHNMQSDMSAAVHMTVVNSLHAPENVRGSAAGGKVTVTWDAVEGATSYNVFRSADGNSFLPLGTSSGTSFTDGAPLPGASYYYCVQALRTDGIHSDMSATLQLIVGGVHDGHEYADLGLPSGIKWATCNVGASSPSDYGDYYAWGETTTKTTYTESNSVTCGKNFGDISGNPIYDAARANWGGSWRLPSKAEWEELENQCTWTWTSEGGYYGYRVKGPNGNSIFVPAAGYRYGSSLYGAESDGGYWSSAPRESLTQGGAYSLYFGSSSHYVDWYDRIYGFSVRPVSE